MTAPPVKPTWIERAIQIKAWHVQQCRDDENWTIAKTANALNRSIGSISQDLLIASWLKTHEKQIRRCSSLRDALAYVRSMQREMELRL
jgi:hypothetical protein